MASAEHVRVGREGGFMQVCHGKAAPLRRLKPGDRVVYYSPTLEFRGKNKLQAFTAIGIVKIGDPYQLNMGGGFCPFRRDVVWLPAHEVSIQPLLGMLEFAAGKRNWGYQFRFGVFPISDHDMQIIAAAMGVGFPVEAQPYADSNIADVNLTLCTAGTVLAKNP
nr:EVE domain-containing protein [Janthinobacterium tructae]